MTKKNLLLLLLTLGLAMAYAIWFTDWFRPKVVKIAHTNRNLHRNRARGHALPNLIFHLNPQIRCTDLKVVPLAAYESNKSAVAAWHLVSDSNSVPLKTFTYGQLIRGLKPAIPGIRAQPLTNNVTYRLLVTAGKIKGEHDFELK